MRDGEAQGTESSQKRMQWFVTVQRGDGRSILVVGVLVACHDRTMILQAATFKCRGCRSAFASVMYFGAS